MDLRPALRSFELLAKAFNPDQPREPAGSSVGGQFASSGSSVEGRIRHALSTSEGRQYEFQKLRRVDVPKDWGLLDFLVKGGVSEGSQGSCYDTSLADTGSDLYGGLIVARSDIDSPAKEAPWAIEHAWSVKDGKIVDKTLGSKKAKGFYYLGEKLERSDFKTSAELRDHIASKLKK